MKWKDFWLAPSQFLQRAEDLVIKADETKEPIWLFYSALETRYCIERLFSQYLFVVSEGKLSGNDEKSYRPKLIKEAILRLWPDFIERRTFYSLWSQAHYYSEPFAVPDLDLICRMYGRLGVYLHLPEKRYHSFYSSSDLDELLVVLKELQEELRLYCYDNLPPMRMNPNLETIFARMKAERLSEDSVVETIRIQCKIKTRVLN